MKKRVFAKRQAAEPDPLFEALGKLVERRRAPPKAPGEFCAADLAEKFGLSDCSARRMVKVMLAAGEIVAVGQRLVGSHRAVCYRLVRRR